MNHLATALEQLDRGTGALARGDSGQARHCFLVASRELLVAAKDCQGEQRTRLMNQANRLLRHARALDGAGENPSADDTGLTPPAAGTPFATAKASGMTLADVAGLEEVKRSFKAKFIYPLRHPEAAARYKQTGSGGMLLYGPPGTGKTFLVRALAGELGAPVFTVKPSEIMSKWVGESEQNLAKLFEQANAHPQALIFIDEIDALAPARRGGNDSVMERLVPQLLAELDGFHRRSNRLLFLGASNEPWSLDPAMMRPGRFDELCFVGLPGARARETMLATHLEGVPLTPEVQLAELGAMTEGYTGADLFGIAMKATQAAYVELIETGRERPVDRSDFERAIAGTPCSVTPQMLQRYQDFRAGRQP